MRFFFFIGFYIICSQLYYSLGSNNIVFWNVFYNLFTYLTLLLICIDKVFLSVTKRRKIFAFSASCIFLSLSIIQAYCLKFDKISDYYGFIGNYINGRNLGYTIIIMLVITLIVVIWSKN